MEMRVSIAKLQADLTGNWPGKDLAHVGQILGAALLAGVTDVRQLHGAIEEVINVQMAAGIKPPAKNDPVPTGDICTLCGGAMVRYPCPQRGIECLECGQNPARTGQKI
jgi:hypothetical protein